MLGRFFFIGLLLIGSTVVALFVTRTGYRVWQVADEAGVGCVYWIGFGLVERRHEPVDPAGFECPLLVRDVAP